MAVFSTNRETGAEGGNITFLLGAAEISPIFSVRRKLMEWENDLNAMSIEDASWKSRDLISICQSDLNTVQLWEALSSKSREFDDVPIKVDEGNLKG